MTGSATAEVRGAMAPDVATFAFTTENEAEVARILARYPSARKASAVLPLLHLAQAQHGGWLPRAALDHVARLLAMPPIRVYEVASFYDMFNTVPVGRVQVRVCTTTPCWLCGSDEIVRACREVLGCEIGQSTADGRFFLREFECLGACANAPVLWVDDDFYEDLDYASARRIVEALQRGERPAPGSQTGRQGSMPQGGKTTLKTLEAKPKTAPGPGGDDGAPVDKARPEVEVRAHAAAREARDAPGPRNPQPDGKPDAP
jgi:NADH-quinone oxidoreductase E subunit